MKVDKVRHKVNIMCKDGSLVKGYIHLNEGERILDFLNDQKEAFFAVTNAEFSNVKEIHSFKLLNDITKRRNVIFLSKSAVKMLESI